MSNQFDNVSVIKKSNVFFDGKCVSHTVMLADGTKKSVGVILPSSLVFNTGVPEIMEITAGNAVRASKVRQTGHRTRLVRASMYRAIQVSRLKRPTL